MLTTPASTSAANERPPDPRLPDSGTPAQPTSTAPLTSTAPPDPQPNWQDFTYPTDPSQRPSNAQVPASESAPPQHRIPVFEYQWGDELVGQLLALPPRSNFGGKFAIIADPGVDNAMRAQVFADQLRSQGVPISYVAAHSSVRRASLYTSSHFLRIEWHILHRAHRAHSAHTHLSFPASARTSALAGSSFLLVTTLRIPMVCLASASVWRSITPLAETSPALPPHVVSHVFNQLGREACSVTSPRASRCSEATQPVTGWCTQTEVNNITTGKGNTWWSDYRCLDLRIASCATLNLSAAHCHRHILYYKISVPRDRPTARTRGRV